MDKQIQPVLLGADLNCYNVARAFHEKYSVISDAFGRYAIGATEYTRIVRFHAVENFDEIPVLLDILTKYAKANEDKTLILIGCTDDYVALISKNKDTLSEYFVIPYIDYPLMEEITLKDNFYKLCDRLDIPHPKTKVIAKDDDISAALDSLGFDYPIIIKPSSSTVYWHFPFDGMKKVYRAHSRDEAVDIIGQIYKSGYYEKLILQDTIPGDDSHMYVLTAYCDSGAKVRMMALGHVLLEEHTPKGLGNHCAIITEYNHPLMERFKTLLEDIGYVGFANFDIKYDERDGSYRAFEINTRLGRSNYYVTATGHNPAEYIVEDFVLHHKSEDCDYNQNEIYWRYIPDKIVYHYVSPELANRVKALIKAGKAYSSMRYKFDTRRNPKRCFFIFMHERHHIKKFKKYYIL
ncbi:MAG: ATP-grasp domain-containing protein [Eubacteriales bacterium]